MAKKEANFLKIKDFDLEGKTVLTRVDLNTPIDPQTRKFLDTRRLEKHAETVKTLSEKGAKVVLLAHQGRPGAEYDFTNLKKHAEKLSEFLGKDIKFVPDLMGPTAKKEIKKLGNGEILLLDNVRFLSEELLNRPSDVQATTHFVRSLAPLADYFVNDAFAAAHRSQPSLVGFCEVVPSMLGKVLENEIKMLDKVLESKKKPYVFVAGGAKIKNTLNVIEQLLNRKITDKVLTSGLIASIFLVAKGYEIRGAEYVENYDQLVSKASSLLKEYNSKIELPMDLALDKYGKRFEVSLAELPLPYRVADIGTGTIGRYKYIIEHAGTVIANGPAGIFEEKEFSKGTIQIVKAIADSKSFSIVGGGHIATAVSDLGVSGKITHISTGGGACIRYLAGEPLPALETLKKAAEKFNSKKKSGKKSKKKGGKK